MKVLSGVKAIPEECEGGITGVEGVVVARLDDEDSVDDVVNNVVDDVVDNVVIVVVVVAVAVSTVEVGSTERIPSIGLIIVAVISEMSEL